METTNRIGEEKKVLVVDDDEICRCVTAEILTGLGLRVHVAPDAAHAIALAEDARFDLILLDMHMPEMDGKELAGILLKGGNADSDALFILTGSEDATDAETTPDGQALRVIRKPLEGAWVESFFANHVARKTSQKENTHAGAQIKGFDIAFAVKNFKGYEAAFFNILREFPDYGDKFISEYSSHLRSKNCTECERLAHSIKGSSLMIGATEINVLARELEAISFASPDIGRVKAVFGKIEEKILEASQSVQAYFRNQEK